MISGTGGGKSSWGPVWLWNEIQGRKDSPGRGDGDYLVVSPTYKLLNLKVLPEFLHLFNDELKLGEWKPSEKVFYTHAPWPEARVVFCSADNPESLESATAKAAWLDEAGQDQFRLQAWEAVQRRLNIYEGRVLITTTPYNLGWLKTEFYDRWQHGDPDYDVINFPSIANPAFPRAEFERMRSVLPAWKFRLFYEGKFTRPENLIYSDYIDEYGGHLTKAFDIPPEWPRFVGIDPGPVHTAAIWLAQDPQKNIFFIYRESLRGEMTTREHAQRILSEAKAENVVSWILGAKGEKQYRMDWRDAGVPVREPMVADVEAGIDKVIELFKTKRLFVFDTCRMLRDELAQYARETDERGEPMEKIKDKESFHLCDALRYAIQGKERQVGMAWL
jgi:hypothetical protein